MNYVIRRAAATPEFRGEWDGPAWGRADVVEVAHFHPQSDPGHRPRTRAKVLYDDGGIYVLFRVADRYVRCVRTEHQSHVYRDSCVEFFAQPNPGGGYFNFEFNCVGTMLLYFMPNPPRGPSGKLEGYQVLAPEELATIRVNHSLPDDVAEIAGPVEWWLEYFVPDALMERYAGPLGPPVERHWRGNFYKCGDDTAHPHWAAWSPVERLDFPQPHHFGSLTFDAG